MGFEVPLYPTPLLLPTKAIAVCHQARGLSTSLELCGPPHYNTISPRLSQISSWLSPWYGRSRLHIGQGLIIFRLHSLDPCKYFSPTKVYKSTVQLFYKRPQHLVWQVTRTNDKQPVTWVGKPNVKYTCTKNYKRPSKMTASNQKLIKMYSKRPGRLFPKNRTRLSLLLLFYDKKKNKEKRRQTEFLKFQAKPLSYYYKWNTFTLFGDLWGNI